MIKREARLEGGMFQNCISKETLETFSKIGLRKFQTVPFLSSGELWGMSGVELGEINLPHCVLTLCHPQATPSWHCLGLLRSNHRTRHLSEQLEVKSHACKAQPEPLPLGSH